LFGQVSLNERVRRFGCDMYHLGSLATFIFSRAQMNALLYSHLAPIHNHNMWGGTYAEVLPYVKAAFAEALAEFKSRLPDRLKASRVGSDLILLVTQLCEPDPANRGHPSNQHPSANQYSLERFISTLDRLAYAAEVQMKAKVA